jgi:Mg2+-importing ATPase
LTLLFFYKAPEHVFQTAWFIESVLTELLIVFIIRTRKSFVRSLPGRPLMLLALFSLIITVILPYSPLAEQLGLVRLPAGLLFSMLTIVSVYLLTADLIKAWFFNKYLVRS